ncbi:MAG TPA: hypothetical protein VFB26_05950 [Gaiellaceae bacterium]|nr:hypothetical protein [Gaiellaceae bacterium]
MFEYAALVAMVGTLSTALAGLQARIAEKLSVSDAVAAQQAVAQARNVGVAPAGARAAYRRAPYASPALRYVYALGWESGAKHRTACAFALLDADATKESVAKAIRASATTRRQLARLRLTTVQAATAFTRGFLSACGG